MRKNNRGDPGKPLDVSLCREDTTEKETGSSPEEKRDEDRRISILRSPAPVQGGAFCQCKQAYEEKISSVSLLTLAKI